MVGRGTKKGFRRISISTKQLSAALWQFTVFLLLGRPGQYTDKVNFKDTRISSTDQGVDISVTDGGSIEVFTTTTDAKNRFAYIQKISKSGVALFAEYEYLDGLVILRVSAQLTPDQAAKYEATLKALS